MLVTVCEVSPVDAAPSRVQVTVVAGPPVETQVRVNTGGSAVRAEVRLNWRASMLTKPAVGKEEVNILE